MLHESRSVSGDTGLACCMSLVGSLTVMDQMPSPLSLYDCYFHSKHPMSNLAVHPVDQLQLCLSKTV